MLILKKNRHLSFEHQKQCVLDYVLKNFSLNKNNEVIVKILKNKLRQSFFNNFFKKLNQLSKNRRNYDNFETIYSNWLNGYLVIDDNQLEENEDNFTGILFNMFYSFYHLIFIKINYYKLL